MYGIHIHFIFGNEILADTHLMSFRRPKRRRRVLNPQRGKIKKGNNILVDTLVMSSRAKRRISGTLSGCYRDFSDRALNNSSSSLRSSEWHFVLTGILSPKKSCSRLLYRSFQLDYQDSNLEKQDQNLLCYHYTIVQSFIRTTRSVLTMQRYCFFVTLQTFSKFFFIKKWFIPYLG